MPQTKTMRFRIRRETTVILPNFLIVGAMKSGTTTLLQHLRNHEDVFIPLEEIYFFNNDRYYRRGLQWYGKHFRDGAGRSAIGEKTPGYCSSTIAPKRIHSDLPEAKLIWILRDPVARIYSHYWHEVRMGRERADFDAVVNRILNGKDDRDTLGYLARGRYAEQIQHYLELFPRNQMLILPFEELRDDPEPIVKRTLEFLEVNSDVVVRKEVKVNASSHVPRVSLFAWTSRPRFRKRIPFRWIRKLNQVPISKYPPLQAEAQCRLMEYYEPHNRELARLLGWDLSHWNN